MLPMTLGLIALAGLGAMVFVAAGLHYDLEIILRERFSAE